MIRALVEELVSLGQFERALDADPALVERRERLLDDIVAPVSDDEARELISVFGPDDYYGLAWVVLHLIETAPHWPLSDCLAEACNEWVIDLRERARRRKG